MALKNPLAHAMRKKFIEDTVNELRKSTRFKTIREIHQYIGEEILFCDLRTIERSLIPQNFKAVEPLEVTNQQTIDFLK